ncbi:MAG TPA: CPBP family intramembrane glutamic endopeptidase [Candidatus Dormibacteraeota bacterium]|nr:CPBP family intramembrane glutamic endopeptidase [Candidatus Dormibacteraeota bacterium]
MSSTVPAARRAPAWHGAAVGLGAAALALGISLLLPRAFSDPVAVDPYVARLAAVSLVLLGAALLLPRLRDTRAVLIAMAAIVAPFTLWSATPRVLGIFWPGLGGDERFAWAGVAQTVLTLAFVGLAWLVLQPDRRPAMRLARFTPTTALICVGGSALLLGVALALPATWLGRLGLPTVALARDMPWVAPGDVLQAAAQELEFRGLLMGALERVTARPWIANLAQATFFGLAHIAVQYQGPAGPFVPVTIALGFVLGWVTQRTGSLWPAIVIHAVGDVAVDAAVLPGLYGF